MSPSSSGVPSSDRWSPLHFHTSPAGLGFIYHHEALRGVSDHLHWPGGSSGVTLGPGYDMKERSAATILHDMQAIGVPLAAATQIAGAAHLRGRTAQAFVDDNDDVVCLTQNQEMALLSLIVPHYEAIVKRNVHGRITQYEFDALVSFAYNPGGSVRTVGRQIDHGHITAAMNIIRARISTGGHRSAGLLHRRNDEIDLFLHGTYRHAARPHSKRHHAPKHPAAGPPQISVGLRLP